MAKAMGLVWCHCLSSSQCTSDFGSGNGHRKKLKSRRMNSFLCPNGTFSHIWSIHFLHNVVLQDLAKKFVVCWLIPLTCRKPLRVPNGCDRSTIVDPLYIPVWKFHFFSLLLCNTLLVKSSPEMILCIFPYAIRRPLLLLLHYYINLSLLKSHTTGNVVIQRWQNMCAYKS